MLFEWKEYQIRSFQISPLGEEERDAYCHYSCFYTSLHPSLLFSRFIFNIRKVSSCYRPGGELQQMPPFHYYQTKMVAVELVFEYRRIRIKRMDRGSCHH